MAYEQRGVWVHNYCAEFKSRTSLLRNGSHLTLLTATRWPMLPTPQGSVAMSICHTPSILTAAKLYCVNFTHVKCCTDTYTSLLFNTNIIILFKRN